MKVIYIEEATSTLKAYPESVSEIMAGQNCENWIRLGVFDNADDARKCLNEKRPVAEIEKTGNRFHCTAAEVNVYDLVLDEDGSVVDCDFCGTIDESKLP